MSYDLWVESPHAEFVRKEDLQARLGVQGWEIRFLPTIASWREWDEDDITAQGEVGPLDEDVLLVAWPPTHSDATLFAHWFAYREAQKLQILRCNEGFFGVCVLSVARLSATKSTNYGRERCKTEYNFHLSSGSKALD